jgi:hypothetical protein
LEIKLFFNKYTKLSGPKQQEQNKMGPEINLAFIPLKYFNNIYNDEIIRPVNNNNSLLYL